MGELLPRVQLMVELGVPDISFRERSQKQKKSSRCRQQQPRIAASTMDDAQDQDVVRDG
jgi:hypothetical protein